MKPISDLAKQYSTVNAAAVALKVHPTQLKRWIESGAMVDDCGNIWIKTKGKLKCQQS